MGVSAPFAESDFSRRRLSPARYLQRLGASGLGAAILVAMLSPSITRKARIRRALETMSDMRAIGTAVEAFAVERGHYPSLPDLIAAGPRFTGPVQPGEWKPPAAWPITERQQIRRLDSALSGRYIPKLPVKDRWGRPFLYATTRDQNHYAIVSTGPDRRLASFHKSWWDNQTDRDLVYADGSFLEWLQWG